MLCAEQGELLGIGFGIELRPDAISDGQLDLVALRRRELLVERVPGRVNIGAAGSTGARAIVVVGSVTVVVGAAVVVDRSTATMRRR